MNSEINSHQARSYDPKFHYFRCLRGTWNKLADINLTTQRGREWRVIKTVLCCDSVIRLFRFSVRETFFFASAFSPCIKLHGTLTTRRVAGKRLRWRKGKGEEWREGKISRRQLGCIDLAVRLSQVVQVYVYSGIRDTETAKRCQSKMPAAPSKRFTDLFISVATSTESKCKQRSRSCRNYVLLIEQRIRFESICRRKRYLLRSTSFNLRGGVQSFKLFVNAARLKLAIENRMSLSISQTLFVSSFT